MLQTIIAGQTLFHQHSIREFPDELLARIVLTRVSDPQMAVAKTAKDGCGVSERASSCEQ